MSAIDGVGGSTVVSSTTGEVDLPPPAAAPEPESVVGEAITEIGVHLGCESVAAGLETLGVGMGVGGAAVVSGLGQAVGLISMAWATVRSGDEGTRQGALYAALGGDGSASSRAFGAGVAACMLGVESRELGAMRDAMPRSLRDDFEAGVDNAHEAAEHEPVGWMEARAEYRQIFRDYTDGRAAALGGWNDPGRGEVFAHAREEMAHALEANPAAASRLRTAYYGNVREGFMAAETGHVNEARLERDAAYRAGVSHERREAAAGDDALSRARAAIVGVRASELHHAPIGG